MTAATYQHIFYEHLLPRQHLLPLIKPDEVQIWPSVLLLFSLGLIVALRMSAATKVERIIQSTFSKQLLLQLEREETNPFKFYSLVLNLLFIINVSFLIYKVNSMNKLVLATSSSFTQFCFFLLVVFVAFSLKTLLNGILAFFTAQTKIISEYTISSTLLNQSLGLFLFPFVVLAEFSALEPLIFIFLAVVVMAAAIILKWYRGIRMSLVEERIGLLQIFSYFCSLEILPVFVLVKYIVETF